jgi:hypothetical protein
LYLVGFGLHILEKGMDTSEILVPIPKKSYLFLSEIFNGTMYGEVELISIFDQFILPLTHDLSFPADHSILEDRESLVRDHQVRIDSYDRAESFTDLTGPQGIIETEKMD